MRGKNPRQLPEQRVAALVAKAVVDGFEPVQIHHHDGEAVVVSSRAVGFLLEPVSERACVGEARQRLRKRACLGSLVLNRVGDGVRSQFRYGFDKSQVIRFVFLQFNRIQGESAQDLSVLEKRHDHSGFVLFLELHLESVEVEARIAVVHRVPIRGDPSGDAGP